MDEASREEKKARGKLRYDRRQTRLKNENARKHRTRSSDIAPKQMGQGIPPNYEATRNNSSLNIIHKQPGVDQLTAMLYDPKNIPFGL